MTLLSKNQAFGRTVNARLAGSKPLRNIPTYTRVMVFGTFDIVHLGHRKFFSQARKLASNPYLIVSLARDRNVLRIKGRRPANNQFQRRLIVQSIPLVDRAILGGYRDHLPHIVKEQPDIIALGYDQVAYVSGLRELLKQAGLKTKIVRLKAYKPHLYKTSLLSKKKLEKTK